MQVMVHHHCKLCTHKYKTNASYGCTIDVLISIMGAQMQVMGAPLMGVLISIIQMQVMGAPLMYS